MSIETIGPRRLFRRSMLVTLAILGAISVAGCGRALTSAEEAAINTGIDLGAIVGSQLLNKECIRLTKKAADFTSTCLDASGAVISIAAAEAKGLIPASGGASTK